MPSRAWRTFVVGLLITLSVGCILRLAWLTADPPAHATVGIVWHDEGPWVHNARNKVLWGTWRTDDWNPMFIAPVFTGLEFIAFRLFGVGTWQARTVPVASGLAAVVLLALGLCAATGRRAALIGAVLLATNYVFVMWNRAALMESTMTAFIVASWAAYALAARRPALGFFAGAALVFAWFTKASAAFFVAAIVVDVGIIIALSVFPAWPPRVGVPAPDPRWVRAAWWTLAGLCTAAGLTALLLADRYGAEYWFYNWQISVERKPSYTLGALLDRASWLPIAHDFFTRMWLVTVAASIAILAIVARWRTAAPALRLLVLWVLFGFIELIVHDSGNERRYIMFIPALAGLAAWTFAQEERILPALAPLDKGTRFVLIPVLLAFGYLVIGAVARLPFLYQIGPGVRLSTALTLVAVTLIVWRWRAVETWLARQRITSRAAAAIVGLAIAGD